MSKRWWKCAKEGCIYEEPIEGEPPFVINTGDAALGHRWIECSAAGEPVGQETHIVQGEPHRIQCDRCDGCGWHEEKGPVKTTCEKCGGKGYITAREYIASTAAPAVPAPEIRFRPPELDEKAAAKKVYEALIDADLSHTKTCAVHEPTLRPCSCGLETRMRDEIKRLRAASKPEPAAGEGNMNFVMERWDQTEPHLQREITFELVKQLAAQQQRIADLTVAIAGHEANRQRIIELHGYEGYDAIGGVCKMKEQIAELEAKIKHMSDWQEYFDKWYGEKTKATVSRLAKPAPAAAKEDNHE